VLVGRGSRTTQRFRGELSLKQPMVLLDQKLAEPWGLTGQWMCGDLAGNAFQRAVDCDNQQN
jgi:hypothetical protein